MNSTRDYIGIMEKIMETTIVYSALSLNPNPKPLNPIQLGDHKLQIRR